MIAHRRRNRIGLVIAAVVAIGLASAGCAGGSEDTGVAVIGGGENGSTSSTDSAPAATSTTAVDSTTSTTEDPTDPDDTTTTSSTAAPEPPPDILGADEAAFLDVSEDLSWQVNPQFQTDIGGGEGIPVYTAVVSSFPLHAQPLGNAPDIARFEANPGAEVDVIAVRRVTHTLGVLRPLEPQQLTARSLGDDPFLRRELYYSSDAPYNTLVLDPDDAVLVLAFGPEGSCFVAIAGAADAPWQGLPDDPEGVVGFPGDVFDAPVCPGGPGWEGRGEPETDEWVLIADDDGESLGWARLVPGVLEITDVRF